MNRTLLLALAGLFLAALPVGVDAQGQVAPLAAFKRKWFANCLWSMERAKVGGQEVEGTLTGLGGEETAIITYDLGGDYDMFESLIGYLSTAPDNRSAVFEVWADGALFQKFGPIHSGQDAEWMRVPIKGARVLTLRIVPDGYDDTHGAAWGSPKIYKGIGKEFPGALLVNINGHTSQAMPSMRGKQKEIPMPVPLVPGVQEYRVRVEFDEASGKVNVVSTPVGEGGK